MTLRGQKPVPTVFDVKYVDMTLSHIDSSSLDLLPFSATFVTIMSAHVQQVHIFYFWSQIYDIKWIQRPRFPKRREDFTCKPTFRPKGTLSEVVKKRKLHLFFSLAKWIYVPNLIKIRREMGALS